MLLNLLITLILLSPRGELSEPQAIQFAQADFEAGNYTGAVKTLTPVHDSSPRDAAINYWLARCYYEQENFDQAVAYAEQAVKWSPENSEYQRWLGRAYGAKAEQSHSFFLARKVKNAFEAAVTLAPRSIAARRDLMQYLVEAPWIVGGDKDKAKQQIDSISNLDPIEGHLARAAYFSTEKKWKEAETEYLAVLDGHPGRIEPYMEAAEFFAGRKDRDKLDRAISGATRISASDPRLDFYRAVVLVLRHTDLPLAESLLHTYVAKVPQRSDYPSHNRALVWLRAARS
jgi:tetratricopeptide (TPR) repeat protein